MNTLLTNEFLETSDLRKTIHAAISQLPRSDHSMKKDALLKWIGIIEIYHLLDLNAKTLVDVGCGVSPLSIYF